MRTTIYWGLGAAALVCVGCSASSDRGGTIPSTVTLAESEDAIQLIDDVPWLGTTDVREMERQGEVLAPRLGQKPRALVTLPARANGALTLRDPRSSLSAEIILQGSTSVTAKYARGFVVYPRAAAGEADVIERVTPAGVEDYVRFLAPPATSMLRYSVLLGDEVAGLRLVANTLELLDGRGAPRLRVAAPYVVDAHGRRHDARLAVHGCAADTNPAAPWGRPVTAPGAARCDVEVSWSPDGLAYPLLVDPSWTDTGNMSVARGYHSATYFKDATSAYVLVAGGFDSFGEHSSAEIYDVPSMTWAATSSMASTRSGHQAGLTSGNKIVVAGGNASCAKACTERYDTTLGTWSGAGTMSTARLEFQLTVLSNLKLLATGGYGGMGVTSSAELYDPATNGWTLTGSMNDARASHTATRFASGGRVLIAGGQDGGVLSTAEIYLPATGTFTSVANMPNAAAYHAAALLGNGRILITGGDDGMTPCTDHAIDFNPTTSAWSVLPNMSTRRCAHVASPFSPVGVMVAGGSDDLGNILASTEVYNGTVWSSPMPMADARYFHNLTYLGNYHALVTGGLMGGGVTLMSTELFSPL